MTTAAKKQTTKKAPRAKRERAPKAKAKPTLSVVDLPMPTETDLDPVATMVLKRAITAKRESLAKGELSPGVYPVNEVVYFKGELTMDEPTEARPTTNLLSVDTVAFLLYRLGVKAPEAITILREMAERTLNKARGVPSTLGDEVGVYSAVIEGFKTEFEKMAESLPKQKRAGAIRYKGKTVRLTGAYPTLLRTGQPED